MAAKCLSTKNFDSWNKWMRLVVRLDDSLLLEAGEGRVHAEVEPGYEEVVGVVIPVK